MKHKKILALIFVFSLSGCSLLLDNMESYINQDAKDNIHTLSLRSSNNLVVRDWNYTWGGIGDEEAMSIGIDSLDNIYLAGFTNSFGALNYDICILKYNSIGALQWNYTWGGAGNERPKAIGLDSLDNIYLAGYTNSFGALDYDLCLLKYNSMGVLQWNYTWGGTTEDEANGLAIDSNDNIYLVGRSDSFGALGHDLCLLKYNSMGILQWNYTWGGAGKDTGFAIGLDSSGNIYLAGATESFGALGSDICILKYNSMGILQWNYTWGGAGNDFGFAIGLDSSDNIYIAGVTHSFGALGSDVCILKYNSMGTLQWNYTWGGAESDGASAIGFDSLDNIFIAGGTNSFGSLDFDVCILKYNSIGVLQLNYTWGGAGDDWASAIGLDSSDKIYIAGVTDSFGAFGDDILIVKFDGSPLLPNNELPWIIILIVILSTAAAIGVAVAVIILIRKRK